MWKNIVEPEKPQTTKWRMSIAYSIPKATDTHSQYVIRIVFPLQQWLHERVSMSHYVYYLSSYLQMSLKTFFASINTDMVTLEINTETQIELYIMFFILSCL